MAFYYQRLRKLKSTTRLFVPYAGPVTTMAKRITYLAPEITAFELADVEIDSVFGDVQRSATWLIASLISKIPFS